MVSIDSQTESQRCDQTAEAPSSYAAPMIEQVINADEIEREVHYAGGLTCPTCNRMNGTV